MRGASPFILHTLVFGLLLTAAGLYAQTGNSAGMAGRDDIKVLYKEGIALYKSGKLEDAKQKFKDILDVNPLYEPARSKLRLVIDTQNRIMRRDMIIAGREKVLDAESKWAPPARKNAPAVKKAGAERFRTKQRAVMEKKAQQIIPEISFTDAHLRDVLRYLSRISGVNIVLDEDIFAETGGGAGISALPKEAGAPSGEVMSDRVTISLKNIPLIEALRYILTAKGLKYRIDEYAIVVSTPERLADVDMQTRYYHLSSGIGSFTEYVEPQGNTGETFEWEQQGEEKKEATLTIEDVLKQSGVPFPEGSKIFLDKRTGTLIVRNTPSNLAVIEEILRTLDVTPYQIEIEARFVQIKSDTAKELGLEWMITSGDYRFGRDDSLRWDSDTTDLVYGRYPDSGDLTGNEGITRGLRYLSDTQGNPLGNILSISGVLTQPQFRMIMHALNQTGDADLVSSPKVTTLNNQRAQIEMVEEFIYPGEVEVTPPTVSAYAGVEDILGSRILYSGNITTKVITPGVAVPVNFETRDLGVVLNVTPSVGADRKTVTLTLIPEISEFKGWIDYGIAEGPGWNAIPIKKPIFETRNVTTSVVINDGETVVLGGLVKEDLQTGEDKIPVLGDIPFLGAMFRSRKEVSNKTNLVVFVTAKLITPRGTLLKDTQRYEQ